MSQQLGLQQRLQYGLLSFILLLYATFSLYQLALPGLHYDEAFEAVPAVQLLEGQPVTAFRDSGLRLNGQLYPVMTQDYIGAVNTYAALPFIAALGPTPVALRLMAVLVGAVTLWLAYLLTTRLTGNGWVGLIAASLLAVDPTFIFWNRQGVFVTAVTATIGLAATYCWLRRFEAKPSHRLRWTLAGAFLFGLGVYAKLLFLWLIAALVGAAILLHVRWLWTHRRELPRLIREQISLSEVAAGIGAFLLGGWPLIVYNWQTSGTVASITANAGTSYYGVDNYAFAANLLERIGQFFIMMQGSHLWYLGEVVSNPLPAVLFVGLIILLFYSSIRSKDRDITRALFPLTVIGLVIVCSIQTVSALWVTHFALLMPWPAIALAVGGWYLFEHPPFYAKRLRPALFITLAAMLLVNGWSVMRYHHHLSNSGGLSSHSDAIYDLTAWLADRAETNAVVAMDWGLAAPITYLTGGEVTPVEVFGYGWDADRDLTTRFEQFVAQPDNLYLWRAPDEVIFDRSAAFQAYYRPRNLEENIEEAFYEESGRPILGVTRLVPAGTAENPPQ